MPSTDQLRYASRMETVFEKQPRPSDAALIAPLLPFLMAPLINLPLRSRLPSPSLRALVVALIVLSLSLASAAVLRALQLRPPSPRQLGPAGLAVALGALAMSGVYVTSLMS